MILLCFVLFFVCYDPFTFENFLAFWYNKMSQAYTVIYNLVLNEELNVYVF